MPQTRPSTYRPSAPPTHIRALYSRVLQSWATDLLELRRRGLNRPGFRRGAWEHLGTVAPTRTTRAAA